MNPKQNFRGPSSIDAASLDINQLENVRGNAFQSQSVKVGFHSKSTPAIQRKLSKAEDENTVMRKEKVSGNAQVSATFESSVNASKGSGSKIDRGAQKELSGKFGTDFSGVKIHNNSRSHKLAAEINAKAFTIDQDIYFNSGEYQPHSREGKHLLAHELMHTVQQGQQAGAENTVQRDLLAYNRKTKKKRPRAGIETHVFYDIYSAEAPGLRKALASLIKNGKIIVSQNNKTQSWFAANDKTCSKSEIETALTAGGYSNASELADKISAIHSEATFYNQTVEVIQPGLIWDTTVSQSKSKNKVVNSTSSRWLTAWEMSEARRVFKSVVDLNSVRVSERSIGSALNYARTIGNFIAFPVGQSNDMELIMHELTHVWQYQKMGVSYAPKAIWAQITEGYIYKDKNKTVEETLVAARRAKKTLYSYNLEQQGDIISDYYKRLVHGGKTAAFLPFINDIK